MYLYIFDYSDCTICEIDIKAEDEDLNTEELVKEYNIDLDACAYMWSENKLEIIKLEKDE